MYQDPSAYLTTINLLSDKLQRAMAPSAGMDYEAVKKIASEIENAAYQIFLWAEKKQIDKEEAEWEANEAAWNAKVQRCNDAFGGKNGSV